MLGIEVRRGIANDLYLIVRGDNISFYIVWIVIDSIVVVTGLLALRASRAPRKYIE